MRCEHANLDTWRDGKYESEGRHGPPRTRSAAGETVHRSWTHCVDCGMRMERVVIVKRG